MSTNFVPLRCATLTLDTTGVAAIAAPASASQTAKTLPCRVQPDIAAILRGTDVRSAGFQPAVSPNSIRQSVGSSRGQRIGNPRYSRLKICATGAVSSIGIDGDRVEPVPTSPGPGLKHGAAARPSRNQRSADILVGADIPARLTPTKMSALRTSGSQYEGPQERIGSAQSGFPPHKRVFPRTGRLMGRTARLGPLTGSRCWLRRA